MRFELFLASVLMFAGIQAAEATQLKIILRYDDYSGSSNANVEQALFEAARTMGGGVLVGVIPFPGSAYPTPESKQTPLVADLDEKKIDLLRRYASRGIVEIAVHGFSHKNNATEGPKSEFTGLPEKTQALLLSIAKASLEDAVGLKVRTFIPPYNEYDIQTLKALEDTGYKLISANPDGLTSQDRHLAYLPGGLYPQRLKDVVISALSKHQTDAIVISTIHPYDIVGAAREMPDFRRGSAQLSINNLIDDLRQIKQFNDVRFVSVDELFETGEDLSSGRLKANSELTKSFVTRHRLLPEAFDAYPITGLYYSRESANRIYVLQNLAFTLLYGALALIVTFATKILLRRCRDRRRGITVLVAAISAGGVAALVIESLFRGLYITSALALTCCLGALSGIAVNRWRNA